MIVRQIVYLEILALSFVAGALAPPARADQFRMAADNARIDCVASKRELTRISLVGDSFASLNKVATGVPYNDFSVVAVSLKNDIYLSVPETYAAKAIN
ncbi:TraK domain-containing protein, partial [Polymorphobacter multimanifer]|uniref:TraK domain-containing protein n=1 Tax=Polymorphobacter multimanifer TaxID=1070431 RepID=UPI001666F304